MAKIAIDAINITYSVIKDSALYNAVDSNVFKGKKPDNFKGECIVITALPMTKDQLQVCRVMVNVFVPNLDLKISGKPDNSQPNLVRIAELSRTIEALLEEYDHDEHSLAIEQDYMLENEGFDEHYNNFRVVFRNENI